MSYIQLIILAIIQGLCELLPVSSSAHVIVAEKLMGLDPSSPEMTLLLVMLHTGTMFAVIVYFWRGWSRDYFASQAGLIGFAKMLIAATVMTAVVFLFLKILIEKVILHGYGKAEVETLFSNLPLVASALGAAGILIIYAGVMEGRAASTAEIGLFSALWIGAVQGIAIPFRGFSRSGSTISTGLILGAPKRKLEEFSFALAVILTPAAIAQELHRFMKVHALSGSGSVLPLFGPSLAGMVFSFLAGLLALKWLSHWLEAGQWKLFGFYCVAASAAIFALHYIKSL